MFGPQISSFPEPFSPDHVERLRDTYARVLPLVGAWVATFFYTDWSGDPWTTAARGWIIAILVLAWAVLRLLPDQTLLILRGALWLAFGGFTLSVFLQFHGASRALGNPVAGGGEHYGLAVLIIAAHTVHTPSGARFAGLVLWLGSSAAAIAGMTASSLSGTVAPGITSETIRFLLAGAIAIGLMDIFSRLSTLQVRSAVQNSLLQQYALTDALTNLPNRRAFQRKCEKEFSTASPDGRPMSLIVLDIDSFKQINDTHGHDAGDRVLRQLAQVVRSVVHPSDYPVRWGGDEFAVLLPDSNLSHARLMAEKIRLTIESFPFDVGPVTVSLGAALLSSDRSVASLFQRADRALYEAKRLGRNRIEVDHRAANSDSVEQLRLALYDGQEAPETQPQQETEPRS